MHLHTPHINPRQRAMLRSLLGAIVAILAALILIALMAFLLVFPEKTFGSNGVASPQGTVAMAASILLSDVHATLSVRDLLPNRLKRPT